MIKPNYLCSHNASSHFNVKKWLEDFKRLGLGALAKTSECLNSDEISSINRTSHFIVFRHVDVVKTTCLGSNRASDCERELV